MNYAGVPSHEFADQRERRTVETVYVVEVFGRDDGIYIFRDEADADRFEQAVLDAGGEAYNVSHPVCDTATTDELIEAEREDDYEL